MRLPRRLGMAFSFAIAAAWIGLSSCATLPVKANASESKTETPASPEASGPKAPTTKAAAPKAADSDRLPEISLPYRRSTSPPLIFASLDEPIPPPGKVTAASPKAAAPLETPPAVVAAPAPASKAAPASGPPASPAPKAAAPKAAAPKVAAPKVAVTKASSKPDAKAKEGETKNAASTASLAMVSDPISEKKPDIARNFSAVVGTRFEIPFDGTGWTYLGEQNQKEGIAYNSRRFDATSLVFLLDPTKAGDYILRFQKQDSLRGTAYEELVGVSVAAKPAAAAAAAIPAATSSAAVAASPAAATPASAAKTHNAGIGSIRISRSR